MRSIYISSVIFAYLAMAVTAIQQLVTVPLAVDMFGESGYGIFATYLSLAGGVAALLGWVSTASAPVLSNALHSEDTNRATRLFHTLKNFHSFLALLLIPLLLSLYFVTDFLRFNVELHVFPIFLAALFYTTILIATSVEPMMLFAAARADLLNRYRCISQTTTLLLFLFILFFTPDLALLFVAGGVGTLVLHGLCRRGLRLTHSSLFQHPKVPSYREFRSLLLTFSTLAGSTSVIRTLLMLDPVLIALLLEPASVTTFSYYWLPANFVILSLWKFSESAQPLFMKAFGEKNIPGVRSVYRKIHVVVLSSGILAAALYCALLAPFQSIWVAYDEYNLSIACIFSIYILCASIYRLDFAILYATMRFRQLLLLAIIEFTIKLGGTIALLPYCTFFSSIAAQTLAHLLVLQWYAKYLVRKELSQDTN